MTRIGPAAHVRRNRQDAAAFWLTLAQVKKEQADWIAALHRAEALPPGPARERAIDTACTAIDIIAGRLLALGAL